YTTHKPGFKTFIVDGRVWVFAEDSPQIAKFKEHGELAKQVIRPGGGPQGMTIKSEDAATIDKYMNDKPGFVTAVVDGRLWIFRPGSEDLAEFKKNGEPAKFVTFPNAGRRGMTLKAPDRETILAYLAAVDGFETFIDDGRVWVFKKGSPDLAEYKKNGEPAKMVIRPSAGPYKMTVKGSDKETINAYLRAAARQ
ncbi:MAG: hypothetical protein MI757_18190, partial [Pirellulales bacterium]|nr:hypothetical protein [Pirellulales bacterium]